MSGNEYEIMQVPGGRPVKLWTRGVPVQEQARAQLARTARLPFVFRHVAVMPDVHLGKGSTIGSVLPTLGAIVPSAVGVDIGCGMIAAKTSLGASDLPDDLAPLRAAIEAAVPHGRTTGRRHTGIVDRPAAGCCRCRMGTALGRVRGAGAQAPTA